MPTLSDNDLAAVARALEEDATVSEPLQRRLENLEGPRRALEFLSYRAKATSRGPQREEWLEVDRVVDAISDEPLRARIEEHSDPEDRRRFVGALLLKSLMVQWQDETQKVVPDEDQLQAYYEQLEPRVRDELMQLPARDFQGAIRERYMEEKAPELAEIPDEIRTVMYRLWMDRRRSDVFGSRRRSHEPDDRGPRRPPPHEGPARGGPPPREHRDQ